MKQTPEQIKAEIKQRFVKLALVPQEEQKFPVGPASAKRLGYEKHFISETQFVSDDHLPFLKRGVPAVDLIDLDYSYWHKSTDTLDKVSARSIGVVGHVILESLKEIEKKVR